jgi:hypothetical protein
VWQARKRGSAKPARLGLLAAAAYVLVMVVSARAARAEVMSQWTSAHGTPPRKLMVGPMFATPLHKQVIVDEGDGYRTGTFSWFSRAVRFDEQVIPKNDQTAAAAVARKDAFAQAVLVWARFPSYLIEVGPHGRRVVVSDVRFGRLINAASVAVPPDS